MSFEEALKIIRSVIESGAKLTSRGSLELLLRHPDTMTALTLACESLKICSGVKTSPRKTTSPKAGSFWRAEDEQRLRVLINEGRDLKEVSVLLGRSISSTRSRAIKMGLIDVADI